MKTVLYFATTLAFLWSLNFKVDAQDWNTGGNNITISEFFGADNSSTIPILFKHSSNGSYSRFEWQTHNGTSVGERMRLTQSGLLGLGVTSPSALFHSFYSSGSLIRTDGIYSNDNRWSMFTGSSAGSQTERFRITTLGSSPYWDVDIDNIQSGSTGGETQLQLRTAEFKVYARGVRLGDFCQVSTGPDVVQFGEMGEQLNNFVHLNQTGSLYRGMAQYGITGNMRIGTYYTTYAPPNIQFDAIADERNQDSESDDIHNGDVFIQGRLEKDTLTVIRLQNGSLVDNKSVPCLFAYNSGTYLNPLNSEQEINSAQGLGIVAKINEDRDNGAYTAAVMEFDSRMGDPTSSTHVEERPIFRWCNFDQPYMTMRAQGRLGLNTQSPNNRLEINSGTDDPYEGNAAGTSGLRFTNMTSGNTPMENPGDGVLSVDGNGDVIYVPGGNDCKWNLTGSGASVATGYPTACMSGNVGIGVENPNTNAKIEVYKEAEEITGDQYGTLMTFDGVPDGDKFGYRTDMTNGAGNSYGYLANVHDDKNAYGARLEAADGIYINLGTYGYASSTDNSSHPDNIGVAGVASGFCSSSAHLIGVYGHAVSAGGTCGTTQLLAGYFAGAVATAQSSLWLSDASVKTNIEDLDEALELIMQLQPKSYNYIENQDLGLDGGHSVGFIADELGEVLPDLTAPFPSPLHRLENGSFEQTQMDLKGIKYTELIPYLTRAIQEQEERINSLENALNECCVAGEERSMEMQEPDHEEDIKFTLNNTPALGLVVPNPNEGKVYLDYYLPENGINDAEILCVDATGRIISNHKLIQRGSGRLNIDTSDLASGNYTCVFIVDGEIIGSRKMVCR